MSHHDGGVLFYLMPFSATTKKEIAGLFLSARPSPPSRVTGDRAERRSRVAGALVLHGGVIASPFHRPRGTYGALSRIERFSHAGEAMTAAMAGPVVHPGRIRAVPRAHHGSGSGRVMEKASEGFTREQRKAHGIRFGASPSRHRGGRAWFLRERRDGRALGLGSRGTTDWKKNPTRQAPTTMFVATMAAHVWTPDHPAVLAASASGRTLRHRMVGTPGAPVSAHSLTVLL